MSRASIQVVGNVGKVGELRFGKSGKAMIKMNVAQTDRVKDRDGEWSDGDTTWYEVTSFGVLAEAISDNVSVGKQVIVLGNLKRSEWEGREGGKMVTFELLADHVGIVPFRNQRGGGQRSDGRRTVREDQMDAPF